MAEPLLSATAGCAGYSWGNARRWPPSCQRVQTDRHAHTLRDKEAQQFLAPAVMERAAAKLMFGSAECCRRGSFLFETGRRAGLGRDPLVEGFLTLDDQHAG